MGTGVPHVTTTKNCLNSDREAGFAAMPRPTLTLTAFNAALFSNRLGRLYKYTWRLLVSESSDS
jgi:hypothetical protein